MSLEGKVSPFPLTLHMCLTTLPVIPLSRVVSEIFNVEKYCDLEMPVKGQSSSLKVVPFDRHCMVAY